MIVAIPIRYVSIAPVCRKSKPKANQGALLPTPLVRINGVGANALYEFGRSFLSTNGDSALHLIYIIAPNVLHTQINTYTIPVKYGVEPSLFITT